MLLGWSRATLPTPESLPPLLVLLYRKVTFGEAAIEDRQRIVAGPMMAATDRLAQQPDDTNHNEAPEQRHADHHHDHPPSADVAIVHPPSVGQGKE